jgi:nucleotide-binding universal stress UspA family protein
MFRHVLVAYDGSDRAQDALALALRLRDPHAGRLLLACAVSEAAPPAALEEVAIMLAAARARIPASVRVALRAPGASSPAHALTELAEEEGVDLIVVGSSRRFADGRIRLERTAGRLLRGAPCAVAVAPRALRTGAPFRHVGIAYDGTPEARLALAAAYRIAAACGAAVIVVYAGPVGDRRLLDEAADTAPKRVKARTLRLPGPAGETIAAVCEGGVDLLVCGSRGYGPMERALMGSVAEQLMEGASHPVLVLPRTAAIAYPSEPALQEATA